MTVVTGATGFLGRHLVARLRAGGERVRVLSRGRPVGLPREVEVVEGSILDAAACARAARGAKRVYHLAGRVSRRRADAAEMYRLHVDGTRVLLAACEKAGVERVVVASTSGTIGVSTDPDAVAGEDDPPPIALLRGWPYYLGKLYQEQLALRLCRERGLPVVVINPSLVLGPGDDRLSSTEDVLRFLQGRVPAVPPGGLSFVDARDVADAAVAACERGRTGQRYLLGAANWTFERFLRALEQVSGVRAPVLRMPRRFADAAVRLTGALTRLTGIDPDDAVSLEMSRHTWYIDSSRARAELGFSPRDPELTLADTVRDLRSRHLAGIPPARPAADRASDAAAR